MIKRFEVLFRVSFGVSILINDVWTIESYENKVLVFWLALNLLFFVDYAEADSSLELKNNC